MTAHSLNPNKSYPSRETITKQGYHIIITIRKDIVDILHTLSFAKNNKKTKKSDGKPERAIPKNGKGSGGGWRKGLMRRTHPSGKGNK